MLSMTLIESWRRTPGMGPLGAGAPPVGMPSEIFWPLTVMLSPSSFAWVRRVSMYPNATVSCF